MTRKPIKIVIIGLIGLFFLFIVVCVGYYHFAYLSKCNLAKDLVAIGTGLNTDKELEEMKKEKYLDIKLPDNIHDINRAKEFYFTKALEYCPEKNSGALFHISSLYLYHFKDYDNAEKYLIENHEKWPNKYTLDMLIDLYEETNNKDKLDWAEKEREKYAD